MKLLVFVLIVIGLIVGSVSVAGKIQCFKCDDCVKSGTPTDDKSCEKCGTTITNTAVKRDCFTTAAECKEQLTGYPVVRCCNNADNCNSQEETKPTAFKCYECTECQKKGGTKSGPECLACKTTTAVDNKISKNCIKSGGTCTAGKEGDNTVECCTADLCNTIVPEAQKIQCFKCDNCLTIDTNTVKSAANECAQCSTTITQAAVKRDCFTTPAHCKEQLTGYPITKCCNGPDNCNNRAETKPTPFKCYECKECPNPFPKEGGTKSGTDECLACKTTTTVDNQINKNCIKSSETCTAGKEGDNKVECCTTDLCNAGVSHSTKKFVLVGLLALAIGAIRY